MRPDVKLGVAISAVVVLVAGAYYLYRDERESPMRLAEKGTTIQQTAGADHTSSPAGTRPGKQEPRTASGLRKPTAPGQQKRGQTQPRSVNKPTARTKASKAAGLPNKRTQERRLASVDPADKPAQGGLSKSPVTGTTGKPGSQGKTKPGAGTASAGGRGTQSKPAARMTSRRRRTPTSGRGPVGNRPGDRRGGPGGTRDTQSGAVASDRTRRGGSAKSAPGQTKGNTRASEVAVDLHRVQPGDTFASLAVAYFGSPGHMQFLIDNNPQIADPNLLSVGSTIKIPARPTGQGFGPIDREPQRPLKEPVSGIAGHRKPLSGAARTYTVRAGDTFYDVARGELGNASRWPELLELNKELVDGDPRRLQVGHVLKLP